MARTFLCMLVCSVPLLSAIGCEPDPTMSFARAIELGNLAEVRANMAHDKYASANGPMNKMGQMPLHVAAEFDQAEVAEYLASRGADINTSGIWSWKEGTPLHVAVAKGNVRVARVLLARGARTDIPDKAGRMVTDRIATSGNAEMIALFANPPVHSKAKDKDKE